MAKDFFDQDLVEARAARTAPPATPTNGAGSDELPSRTISDLNLTRMARYREQRSAQQAEAAKEAETIRRRLEDLDKERRQREDEVQEADRFERGRQEVQDRLTQALALLDKQELQAIRMAELYAGTKQRFKELQEEMRSIHEAEWDEARLREEVNRALVVIEDARKEYGKAMARLEAASSAPSEVEGLAAAALEAGPGSGAEDRSFGDWVRTGFAFFLPLMVFLAVMGAAVAAWRLWGG